MDDNSLVEQLSAVYDGGNSFVFNGIEYELKYNLKTVEVIEEASGGVSVVSSIVFKKGMLSIQELTIWGGNALYCDGVRLSPKKGIPLIKEWMQEVGYTTAVSLITVTLVRDCDCLFQGM